MRLLVDIGSTVVKLYQEGHGVEVVPRDRAVSPGEQVLALADRHDHVGLRVCSSANGGLRVGVLGLSRGHSIAAAARAAVAAGGNVAYHAPLDEPPAGPLPHVDLLVLVGGVDGADLRYLRERIAAVSLADHSRDVLVWAGADAPDIVAGLPVDHVVGNVLDERLRPRLSGPTGLSGLVRGLYVEDLVDRKGLRALAGRTEVPIWPTPAALALAAHRMADERIVPAVTAPFVVVDVGGATTDVLYCAELRDNPATRPAPGESVVRQVCTDLGVAGSLPRLRLGLAACSGLVDLATAIDPDRPREVYRELTDDADLTPGTAFLACLFLALRRLTDHSGPRELAAERACGFVITGGAWTAAAEPAIRRVLAAACAIPNGRWGLHIDGGYELWALGLAAVPNPAEPAYSGR